MFGLIVLVWRGKCVCGSLETSKLENWNQTAAKRRFHREDWVGSELKWNYNICAGVLRWISSHPVILSWDFSLLGSGVRKWSVQPWASLMYVVNLEITITARVMSELYYKMCWILHSEEQYDHRDLFWPSFCPLRYATVEAFLPFLSVSRIKVGIGYFVQEFNIPV